MGNWGRTVWAAIAITTGATLMPEVARGAAPIGPALGSPAQYIPNVSVPMHTYAGPTSWFSRLGRYARYRRLIVEIPTPSVWIVKRDIDVHLVKNSDEWFKRLGRQPVELEPSRIETWRYERLKRTACRGLVGMLWAPVRKDFPGGAGRLQVAEATDYLIREHGKLSSLSDESQDQLARLLMEQAMKYSPLNPWRSIIRDSKNAICGP